MKPFIAGIFILFLFAMGCGLFFAFRNAEGLVETNYYERSERWFQAKATERQLGFEIEKPEHLSTGKNRITFILSGHGKPLQGAEVRLFVGNVANIAEDFSVPMREKAPGVYEASAIIPMKGKWLVRMDLASANLKTSRSWFYDVR